MQEVKNNKHKQSISKDLFHTVYFVKSLDQDNSAKRTSFFVRINTKGMQQYFGKTSKTEINIAGEIVKMQWMQIPVFYPSISLDSFMINGNNVQGIISIETENPNNNLSDTEQIFNFPPPKLLLEAFTHFKACCTKSINASMPDLGFGWQPLFTSLVITNNTSLTRFRDYIQNK